MWRGGAWCGRGVWLSGSLASRVDECNVTFVWKYTCGRWRCNAVVWLVMKWCGAVLGRGVSGAMPHHPESVIVRGIRLFLHKHSASVTHHGAHGHPIEECDVCRGREWISDGWLWRGWTKAWVYSLVTWTRADQPAVSQRLFTLPRKYAPVTFGDPEVLQKAIEFPTVWGAACAAEYGCADLKKCCWRVHDSNQLNG